MCRRHVRIAVKGGFMAKTIFGTSSKSNFILNMDLDKYRRFCAKMLLAVFWTAAVSEAFYQLTYTVNGRLAEMVGEGGFASVLSLLLITLRSTATLFSVAGVLAIIVTVIGMMRLQFTKRTAVPYLLLAASLGWAVISMFHAFDMDYALFGQDGRDEGWIALLMYAAFFYLGTMLRRRENLCLLLRGLLIFGIVQNIWALLQAQPFFDFPSEYTFVEPLLYQNLRLPSGLTDSPVTYAMLSAVLLAIAIPAAICAEKKSTRILGAVCGGLSMLTVFKTQTFAGLIAGIGGLLIAAGFGIAGRKNAGRRSAAVPALMLTAALCSAVWVYFTPAINGAYKTSNDEPVENGFALYDGGIVWDDAFYRLSTAGPYQREDAETKHGFNIYDSASVIRYCWSEGARVIKLYPVIGTGPDNFAFTQLHVSMNLVQNVNTVDRPYNDLLFIGATRGILSMVLHIALLAVCAVLAWKNRRAGYGWLLAAFGCAAALYTLTTNVGISVLTVAPVFWGILGVLAGDPIQDAVRNAKQRSPKPKRVKHMAEGGKA